MTAEDTIGNSYSPRGALKSAKGQRSRILGLLVEARGGWVPLPEIIKCAAQYNARIFELRRLGFKIENRTEEIDGARHSWFRLLNSSAAPQSGSGDSFQEKTGKPRATSRPPDQSAFGPLFAGGGQ
jgi:hypothetical protein